MSENTSTPMTDAEKAAFVKSTRRFDLRRILGGLFLLYGIICTIVGLVDPKGDVAKTGGIAINIWTGIGMLVAGILFFVWDRFAPVPAEDILGNVENEERVKAAGEGRELA
jgi:hypothetical protein